MQAPLLDSKAQYAAIESEVLTAVSERQAVSDCIFAVGVSSGTDAILNSLMSLDIGPGDEVISTPFTFFCDSWLYRAHRCKAGLC